MITNRKITSWETPVSAEADRPQRTASEMKAVFDGNSEQLKSSVNGLIDDLTGSEGAENIGSPSLPGIVANGLWAQIVAFFAKVFGIVKTDQPSNRYLNGAGQYTVPSVGAAANGLPMAGDDNDFLLKNGSPDYATKWQAAGAVRAVLNVADDADNTETAIGEAVEAGELTDTDTIPVSRSGLKKTTFAGLKGAIKAYLDTKMDYVVSDGNVTVDGNTWRVREWRSGRVEATIRIQATNTEAITYIASNGVYRSDPILLPDGIKFPYTLSDIFLYYSIRGIRTGFSVGSLNYDTDGITGIHLWSPVTEPFTAPPSFYLDLMVYVGGLRV